MNTITELTPGQSQALLEIAEEANQELESAGESVASRAFNLGCSITLLPALAVVLIVAVTSRMNWVAIFLTSILALVSMLIVANLVAYTARNNTVKRTFDEKVQPEIERKMNDLDLERSLFNRLAVQRLPKAAVLRRYLPPSPEDAPVPDDSE
jgi:uncharacterized protein (DUF58 family)